LSNHINLTFLVSMGVLQWVMANQVLVAVQSSSLLLVEQEYLDPDFLCAGLRCIIHVVKVFLLTI
jgi:hypothetical protein